MFNNTQAAIEFVNNDQVQYIEDLGGIIQKTINTEDKEAAEQLVKQFNIQLV